VADRTWAPARRLRYLLIPLALVMAALPATAGAAPVAARQAAPTVTHQVIASFDGTPIYSTLFLPPGASATDPVPLVMRSHGWGGHGEREVSEGGLTATLLDSGYAVFTWDERGFGYSGGEVAVLKPELEGRDAVVLIDWIAANVDEVAREEGAPDDPVIGFSGGSYGGGIQLLAAALDDRVDALAPEITWNDLRYSLYGNGVINLGWGETLYALGVPTAQGEGLDPRNPAGPQPGGLAPQIHRAQAEGAATNQPSPESLDFFGRSSLARYTQDDDLQVDVPTLFIQGSVDTLFDLTEAADNFHYVRDERRAPAKLIVFCGGHVSCPSSYADANDRAHLDQAILSWFDRYLRGDTTVDTGAPVEYRTNEGVWRSAADFTPPDARFLEVSAEGTVVSTPVPTTFDPAALAGQLLAGGGPLPPLPPVAALPSTPGDPHAFGTEVAVADDGPMELVGIPTATVTVSGTGPAAHLFLKLVDRETGEVLNVQETPLRVEDLGDGTAQPRIYQLRMSGIAYTLPAGHHLDLQVSTTSVMHATARTPAEADVAVEAEIPVRRAAG
jgi:ABC-2 type transport system ATP-binding protein